MELDWKSFRNKRYLLKNTLKQLVLQQSVFVCVNSSKKALVCVFFFWGSRGCKLNSFRIPHENSQWIIFVIRLSSKGGGDSSASMRAIHIPKTLLWHLFLPRTFSELYCKDSRNGKPFISRGGWRYITVDNQISEISGAIEHVLKGGKDPHPQDFGNRLLRKRCSVLLMVPISSLLKDRKRPYYRHFVVKCPGTGSPVARSGRGSLVKSPKRVLNLVLGVGVFSQSLPNKFHFPASFSKSPKVRFSSQIGTPLKFRGALLSWTSEGANSLTKISVLPDKHGPNLKSGKKLYTPPPPSGTFLCRAGPSH